MPVVAPKPKPHEPLSQSLPEWHVCVLPLAHVPADDPGPEPQDLLSQSLFLWHAIPLVAHVPAVAPRPVPQLPPVPQSVFSWQAAPALHLPVWRVPPHVPRPQSVVAWQGTFPGHVPLPQVPLPHWAFVVQLTGVHFIAAHAPPLQSALLVHSHAPLTQARPVPQSLFLAHAV